MSFTVNIPAKPALPGGGAAAPTFAPTIDVSGGRVMSGGERLLLCCSVSRDAGDRYGGIALRSDDALVSVFSAKAERVAPISGSGRVASCEDSPGGDVDCHRGAETMPYMEGGQLQQLCDVTTTLRTHRLAT